MDGTVGKVVPFNNVPQHVQVRAPAYHSMCKLGHHLHLYKVLILHKLKPPNGSRYLNFISSYEFLNFEFLRSFWKIKIFLENHKHEQIIIGGCGFSKKNAFSKPFQEKNWNKGVLQQFKA